MTININACTIEDIKTSLGIDSLIYENACESSIPEIGECVIDWAYYQELEKRGMLREIAAYDGVEIVGILSIIVTKLPHYSKIIATTESFFVKSEYRKTGLGTQLLKIAEKVSVHLGASALMVSAPHNGRLEFILPRKGYRETSRVFAKSLK